MSNHTIPVSIEYDVKSKKKARQLTTIDDYQSGEFLVHIKVYFTLIVVQG